MMRSAPERNRAMRADLLLVQKGFAGSRAEARAAIDAGRVSAGGQRVVKPSQQVSVDVEVSYARAHPYVSRGGIKLSAALDHFKLSPAGKICLDIGASTGGFTQVLVERGAARVYAVDVGHGQLAARFRNHARVVSLEGTNARTLSQAKIPEPVNFLAADVSFISLKLALPSALALAEPEACLVALFKPQFEVGRKGIGKNGIVRNEAAGLTALAAFKSWLETKNGWRIVGSMACPIKGGDGNQEYLVAARNERVA